MRSAMSCGVATGRATGRRALERAAAGERVEQQRRRGADVGDHEVAGEPDADELDARPPGHRQPQHRQQDRQAAAALEHDVEERVARRVVVLAVAGEAVALDQHLAQRRGLAPRRRRPAAATLGRTSAASSSMRRVTAPSSTGPSRNAAAMRQRERLERRDPAARPGERRPGRIRPPGQLAPFRASPDADRVGGSRRVP